ncbi:tetratricopeptide repeat protein [Phormidium sp. FACHB-592]|jgi:tetratricopeptide (TPR) repeat protein|uniref:Tetratricopeptide repeat protein n=1 Tax=Stenomitos frigidus AS-A4 TaxID=2933935 RepID=A0ABV0KF51_9CYAN|nr:tetratricopeptide repeat protein [Phormidium sp. FACHB-592]MBD2076459.1 tetratricopeptide repeat protein [Phormidium sp. FACHB-592]
MDTPSPLIYISFLLLLLAFAGWSVVRQILKTRKVELALAKLQSKLTKEAGSAQEYYELGSIYLDKKIFSQAIMLFQKALKAEDLQESESAPIYNALGFAYFAQEQYDLAIRQYKEALKIDPNYVTALNNIGHAYERKQLASQALEVYEQALAIEPQNATSKRRAESLRKRFVPSA